MKKASPTPWLLLAVLLILLTLSACAPSGTSANRSAASGGSSWPGLTALDNVVYLATGREVVALELGERTVAPIWTFKAQDRTGTLYATPAVDGDLLVVGDYGGNLFGIDATNGSLRWQFTESQTRFIGNSLITETLVYAPGSDGVLHAIDRENGVESWRFTADRGSWSAPALQDGTLYLTSLDGHLYALDAASGDLLWQYPEEGETNGDTPVLAMVGTPVLHEQMIYFTSFNRLVYALDLETRETQWTYPVGNWVYSSLVLDAENGLLFGADLDGEVFALDLMSGEEEWLFQAGGAIVSSPTLGDYEGTPALFFTSEDTHIYVLDRLSGEALAPAFEFKTDFTTRFLFFNTGVNTRPAALYAGPVLMDDLMLIAPHLGDHKLFAFDRNSFQEQWRYPVAGAS